MKKYRIHKNFEDGINNYTLQLFEEDKIIYLVYVTKKQIQDILNIHQLARKLILDYLKNIL